MTLESPAARAGQLARQLLLFGRIIPPDELVARIEAIDASHVRDLAGASSAARRRVASVGPVNGMMGRDRIAARFGARLNG